MRRSVLLLTLPVLLAGCETIKDFMPVRHPVEQAAPAVMGANRWWKPFNDPMMEQLADQLLAQNIDIKIAQARVDEARGQVRVARSGWFPDIFGSGLANRGDDQLGQSKASSIVKGGLDASWEIDVFGRTRSRFNSAENQEVAAQASVQDVQNFVIAELVKAVIEWHQARQTIKETNDLLVSQQDQVKLLHSRAKAGLIDASFMERAQAEYAQTATQLPLAQASLDAAEYKIEKLLGKSSGELHVFLTTQPSKELSVPQPDKTLDVAIDTIRSRPDIRAAKAQMLAAESNLDAAEADLWPRLTISGFFGAQATSGAVLAARGAGVRKCEVIGEAGNE